MLERLNLLAFAKLRTSMKSNSDGCGIRGGGHLKQNCEARWIGGIRVLMKLIKAQRCIRHALAIKSILKKTGGAKTILK